MQNQVKMMTEAGLYKTIEKKIGSEIGGVQREQLARFVSILYKWSGRVRLISRNDRSRIWEQHIEDCLLILGHLPMCEYLLDLGTGAGLPGIPVKIMRSGTEVHLLEPARMKVLFLKDVVSNLDLQKVIITKERAENLKSPYEGKFECVTARAVAPLPTLWSWAEPLLKTGGVLVAMKGPNALDEFEGKMPEGTEVTQTEVELPTTKRRRVFVSMKKKGG